MSVSFPPQPPSQSDDGLWTAMSLAAATAFAVISAIMTPWPAMLSTKSTAVASATSRR
jgi:hypothetical protein